jgi:IclR family transcriptional regulator, KDG regulon repressor
MADGVAAGHKGLERMPKSMVRSVRRAFDIFEVFARLRRPLSLKELTGELDCPSSSLADLLKTLSQIGCLSFDNETKSYFPTTRLSALGGWVNQTILPVADPYEALKRLGTETGGTILLGTPNDLEIQYLVILEGPNGAHYRDKPNGRRPLVKSGVGWVVLSNLNDDKIERIWRRSIVSGLVTRKELPLATLQERIKFCRSNGYVAARDSVNPDAAVVATSLPPFDDGRQLAIGIGGPADRIENNAANIAAMLHQHASHLARTFI